MRDLRLFVAEGLRMIVDGVTPETIREVLSNEIDYLGERHRVGYEIFEAMGTYAPAFGMIGTLIGLIQMLGNLSDPDALGPGMSVALITTMYGSCIANMVAIPIGKKLAQNSSQEVLAREMMVEGILSIQAGENPRVIEEKLKSFLAPKDRTSASSEEAGGDGVRQSC